MLSSYKNLGRREEYAVAIIQHRMLSNKVTVTIDYGQKRPFMEDSRLTDKDGNIIKFNSAVDVMNYMNTDGWYFMNADILPQGNSYQESLFFVREIQ
jgi:hypothetical protein